LIGVGLALLAWKHFRSGTVRWRGEIAASRDGNAVAFWMLLLVEMLTTAAWIAAAAWTFVRGISPT
jgi:hypothetical protein